MVDAAANPVHVVITLQPAATTLTSTELWWGHLLARTSEGHRWNTSIESAPSKAPLTWAWSVLQAALTPTSAWARSPVVTLWPAPRAKHMQHPLPLCSSSRDERVH